MPAQIYVVPTDTSIGIGCRLDDSAGYKLLYEMKGRDNNKLLAILVPTWEDLAYESTLTPSQVNFLKTYKFPFTIVTTIREDFRDEYPILDEFGYNTVGFRVAEACLKPETREYIRAPIFLTSANLAGEKEAGSMEEVKELFKKNKEALKILPGEAGLKPSSNVIQFVGTSNDLKYIRKNYPLTVK